MMRSNYKNSTLRQAWYLRAILAVLVGVTLAACDSVPTETSPNGGGSNTVLSYTGPSCSTTDACTFKVEFWDKMSTYQCKNCHDSQSSSAQSPFFMESSNVNAARIQALTIVNLPALRPATLDPTALQEIVKKINDGHNCGDTTACAFRAENVLKFITNWAIGGAVTSGAENNNTIVLTPPPIRDADDSRSFPADSTDFETTIWPLLTTNCAGCHTESSPTPQSPYFAESDVDVAYAAVVDSQKINLDDPAISRLVVRLNPELHNCWDPNNTGGADCPASAAAMLAAITLFRDGILPTEVNPDLFISKALDLTDGILASGGNRDDSSTIALYEMKTGSGSVLYDTSGVEPTLNLNLFDDTDNGENDFRWVGGWGIEFTAGGRAQGSAQNSKIRDQIISSGEYSIEAWVVPANVNQGSVNEPARIISYSGGPDSRNFSLGQAEYRYAFRNRSENSGSDGEEELITDDMDEDLQASQQHVVVTYKPVEGRKIYVNGVDVSTVGNDAGSIDPVTAGSLLSWDDSFAFVLGHETGGNNVDYQWKGKLRLVAIHDRAMTQNQIDQNFEAGVGEKFYLMFSVSHLMDDTNCYLDPDNQLGDQCFIYMEVSQFDSYSYLFYKPTFISKNSLFSPSGTVIRGMRIGLNGKEPAVGQAFSNIGGNTPLTITANSAPTGYCDDVDPDTGRPLCGVTDDGEQILSGIGTIIALEKGAGADEFFLSFEVFGANDDNGAHDDYVCADDACLKTTPVTNTSESDIGMRTFEEINATMAALTGIDMTLPVYQDIEDTFNLVKQQLPSSDDINSFLSAHEIGIAQLAIDYCSALVDNNPTYFTDTTLGNFNFSTNANDVTNTQWQEQVIKPLINNLMTVDMDNLPTKGLASQPDPAAVSTELFTLITNPADVRLSDADIPTSNDGIPDGLAKCGGACPAGQTELVVKATCAALLGSAVSLVQ